MASHNTNMDFKNTSHQDGPQLEFTLPISEVGENVVVGQVGDITIKAEVTQVKDGMISFRKRGTASGSSFRQQSLQDLEDEIGVGER